MPDAMRVANAAAGLGGDVVSIVEALGATAWIVDGLESQEVRYVGGLLRVYFPPRSPQLAALAVADLLCEIWQQPRERAWRVQFASALLARLAAQPARGRVEQPELAKLVRVVQR
jgi:hypothetical protein